LVGVSKGGTITVFRVVEEVELCLAEFKGQRRSPEVTFGSGLKLRLKRALDYLWGDVDGQLLSY